MQWNPHQKAIKIPIGKCNYWATKTRVVFRTYVSENLLQFSTRPGSILAHLWCVMTTRTITSLLAAVGISTREKGVLIGSIMSWLLLLTCRLITSTRCCASTKGQYSRCVSNDFGCKIFSFFFSLFSFFRKKQMLRTSLLSLSLWLSQKSNTRLPVDLIGNCSTVQTSGCWTV